jgi:hypothetical protein
MDSGLAAARRPGMTMIVVIVIASEAKQSSFAVARKAGLLRRYRSSQ